MSPELELTGLSAETYESFQTAVGRGFQEPIRSEAVEFTRAYVEFDRFFGFAAGERWASTFGSFARAVTVPGGARVPAAAVTVVTVHPPFRRRGLLTSMMQEELERCVRRGEPLAVLWASEAGIYGRFGYGPATDAVRLNGSTRDLTLRSDSVLGGWVDEVDVERFIAAAAPVWDRSGTDRPGSLDRDEKWWRWALFDLEFARDGASELRHALHTDDNGTVDGFATYRYKDDYTPTGPNSEVRVGLFHAATPTAAATLWSYLLDLDLTRRVAVRNAPADAGLRHLLIDARALDTRARDNVYVRVVDVDAALRARRYSNAIDVVLEVTDQQLPDNAGRYRLCGSPQDAQVERTNDPADVALGVLELGTIYLGGPTLLDLHRAGRVTELTPGAVRATSAAFRGDQAPWCADDFLIAALQGTIDLGRQRPAGRTGVYDPCALEQGDAGSVR